MKTKISGIIYKVENTQNGLVYIGATTKDVQTRKLDHLSKVNSGKMVKFQEAIGTYGPEAFSWKQIDTANSNDELAQKEKNYIFKYDSKKNGYNSDEGGGLKKTVYKYNLEDGSLISTYECLEKAGKSIDATKQNISRACLSVNNTYKGYYWSYTFKKPYIPKKDIRRKNVIQLTLTGEFVNQFNSVSDASRLTEINKTSIAKVCRRERNHAGGFDWKYKLD
ncbi:endonuclease [Aureibaculum algae]|uniref:Endonuclease n=1 Tax=Aureibaculum algae TaxID=2584122 RepID=A0A5B7TXS8_9FLAO|nr:GIY-YIG nuclease family protein [Aureibaculum algae]QCX40134.1 endonuclease [Aureibaculum algae]